MNFVRFGVNTNNTFEVYPFALRAVSVSLRAFKDLVGYIIICLKSGRRKV